MIYLYAYYTIVSLFIFLLGYTAYKAGSWQARVVLGGAAVFAGATAAMLGLLHSWTGDGFGYFAAILRALGVAI
jgi:hypothetical protein